MPVGLFDRGGFLDSVAHDVGNFFADPFGKIGHTIGSGISELGHAVGGVVRDVVQPISGEFQNLITVGGDAAQKVITKTGSELILPIVRQIPPLIQTVGQTVQGFLGSPVSLLIIGGAILGGIFLLSR